MQAEHADEYADVASHMTPGHALTLGFPLFYLNNDAVNMAALDYLVNFTEKVSCEKKTR